MSAQNHNLIACGGVPNARRTVGRRCDHARSIGTEGDGIYIKGVPLHHGKLPAGHSIPDANGTFSSQYHDTLAVTAQGGKGPAQDRQLAARRSVPDTRGIIPRAGDDARAVSAERCRVAVGSAQDHQLAASRGVPDARTTP
jgi:hypothetical protein